MREEGLIEDATEEYRGYTIKIFQDSDPSNPVTDWDQLGKMVCWHRRYSLSSKGEDEKFPDVDSFKAFVEEEHPIVLPLFLFDHSGITIRTSSDSFRMQDPAGWDWGRVGYIYATLEDVKKEYKCKKVTPQIRKKVINLLEREVEVFDDYLTGNVYGYVVEGANGEHIDSCWGFYGWDSIKKDMYADARASIDFEIKKQAEWEANVERTFAD